MKSISILASVALASAALSVTAAEAPLWLRDVAISPDGTTIAFTYKGDIWTVPVAGGQALRITTLDSYDTDPVWSPDSRRIAFASDRHGNLDVYVTDARGGQPRRLTTNSAAETPEAFSADGKEVYYSAAIQAPSASAMFPSSRMTQLYAVPADGGASRQLLGTPARRLSVAPDGKRMVYTDVKGIEDVWRKHHTSSTTSDIWLYDFATGSHKNLTNRGGEDRDGVLDDATGTVYMLSERDGGSFNIYSFPLTNPGEVTQLTGFDTHPVRFLSRASDGRLAFGYNGEIYTLVPGGKPQKVEVSVITDEAPDTRRLSARIGGDGAVSPDGKQLAFVSRGDVFVTDVEYNTTRQVTNTPSAERDVSWGADNRSLYYTGERSGHKEVYKASMARKDDANFANATEISESLLLGGDGHEYSHPLMSPDGKKLAYIRDRQTMVIRTLGSGAEVEVDKPLDPGYGDSYDFVWSPDSRWLAAMYVPEMHDPYTDIALIEASTGKLTDITQNGYFDESPRFTPDGNAIIYLTDKYGMRNHASWGSQSDIMIAFLNREARDRFMLNKEDYALLKDAEKAAKKKEEASDDKDDKKSKKSKKSKKDDKETKPEKTVVVELDGIENRIRRLSAYSAGYGSAIMDADGDNIYYMVDFGNGPDLWKMPVRDGDPSRVATVGSPGQLQTDKTGKQIFLVGPSSRKLDKGSLKTIKVSATHDIDRAAEREAMFDYMATEEAARFYDKNMHGVDWPAMVDNYRRFLPHINNGYDFAEMLSEILGELNVSHTGGRYYGGGTGVNDRTASLGLLYDMNYQGPGLKVDEVLTDGPFDRAASKMKSGSIITAVGGKSIDEGTDMSRIFNNIAGQKTLVSFTTPAGENVSEVVKPVSSGRQRDLLYRRWVRARAADVERWSGGRLGYVHIESMSDPSFRPMYADLFGKYNNCEGVVVDIRWNGGGRMHEDIEVLLSGKKYLTQVIRGKDVCDMPSRRWNKPSIMVVNEPCYSNAHGTPWVYQHQKIGKVVGMPVPGTMTSVNWVTMQDPAMIFGIPVIGYRTAEGNYLENTQLEPDVKVANAPEAIVRGEDSQLRTAVETLLRDIDNAKK